MSCGGWRAGARVIRRPTSRTKETTVASFEDSCYCNCSVKCDRARRPITPPPPSWRSVPTGRSASARTGRGPGWCESGPWPGRARLGRCPGCTAPLVRRGGGWRKAAHQTDDGTALSSHSWSASRVSIIVTSRPGPGCRRRAMASARPGRPVPPERIHRLSRVPDGELPPAVAHGHREVLVLVMPPGVSPEVEIGDHRIPVDHADGGSRRTYSTLTASPRWAVPPRSTVA